MRLIDAEDVKKRADCYPPQIRNVVANILRHTKTVKPEQKRGKWIEDRLVSTGGGTYGVRRCSECEAYYQDVGYGYNYCPNCGADMRGDLT